MHSPSGYMVNSSRLVPGNEALQELRGLLRLRILQLLAFTALMAGVGATCFIFKHSVLDMDIWWHLKVGDWILEHRAVPHTGIFSYTAASRPWIAYSWGYEVLLSRAYAWFGLMGIAVFGVCLTFAVALALFWALHRLAGHFWTAWLLSIVVISAFLFDIMPRPVFVSMVLFTVTLKLILEAQRSGNVRSLYWLPLIFFLWANLHIQFIYGLCVVALFVGINLMQRVAASHGFQLSFLLSSKLSTAALLTILAGCALAACVGPYSYQLYQVVLEYSKAQVPYSMIIELQPLNFASWTQYVELLLASAGFFAVGWQKKLDPFKAVLMTIASVAAFRTFRDAWFICITAALFIADFPAEESPQNQRHQLLDYAGVTASLAVLLLLLARNTDFNSRGLDRAVSSNFPVDAVNFVRKNPLPGPLYNSFDWGGFLIWYMPQYPVAIDGRNDLYGDELDARFFSTEGADPSYAQDPYLNAAGLVLLRRNVALSNMLAMDRRFRVVYRDELSVIFVPSDRRGM